MNKVLETIKSRRSIRRYLPEPLKQAELDAILEAGLYAPSAHNDQPWHFTVIRDRALLDRISRLSKELMLKSDLDWMRAMGANESFHVFHNAPVVVVVSMRKNALSPLVDCSAAIENMLLAAESLDIGSCWIGLARFWFSLKDEVARLNLPEGYEPCYAVTLGYKGHRPEKALPRRTDAVAYMD
ncbi:MAG: nitroreductase [Elusimicrobia bacterium HGW-Elusimicrobia-3]|jgi:nitroreductase|nr:MAG: nitroreductase [Elusimicrobia bacterium HGW-Elusimicrobia-3]